MTELKTEVLIIGAGPGGYVAAIRLAQLGKKVLIAEKARAGGICLNWGCIPTKALLHAVHTLRLAREGIVMGLKFAEPEKDIAQLSAWRGRIVDRLVRGIEYLFKQHGVEMVNAHAEFTDERRVKLTRPDGSATLVEADRIIIATGSEPMALPGLEPDGARVITSNEALLLKSIPPRLLVIGAGAIGLEFASIYAGLGSKVQVVEIMDQVLPGSDPELCALLERALRKQALDIALKTKVAQIEQGETLRVTLEALAAPGATTDDARRPTPDVDQVLVAVGRRPLTTGLGLDQTGVRLTPRGYIAINDKLETTQPGVYAIGDVARAPLLAHKASREGIVAAEQIAGHEAAINLKAIPGCTFTDPELASVGFTESEAQAAGYETAVGKIPLTALGRAATLNRQDGMCKIVADRKTDRVLGVHILAPEASILIGEGVMAVEKGLTARDIGTAVHPHPTLSELMMEAAEAVHNQAIHIPPTRK